MKEHKDEELLSLIADGNQQAFDIFVKNNIKKAMSFCFSSMASYDKSEQEDVVQNTFTKIWINAKKYNPNKGRASTWFYTILRNECLNYHRKNKKHSINHIGESLFDIVVENDSDEVILKAQLLDVVKSLKEKQKTAVILFYYEGYSLKECSEIMKINQKAFSSLLKRAKTKIQYLTEYKGGTL